MAHTLTQQQAADILNCTARSQDVSDHLIFNNTTRKSENYKCVSIPEAAVGSIIEHRDWNGEKIHEELSGVSVIYDARDQRLHLDFNKLTAIANGQSVESRTAGM